MRVTSPAFTLMKLPCPIQAIRRSVICLTAARGCVTVRKGRMHLDWRADVWNRPQGAQVHARLVARLSSSVLRMRQDIL